jgi:hypothetical protein
VRSFLHGDHEGHIVYKGHASGADVPLYRICDSNCSAEPKKKPQTSSYSPPKMVIDPHAVMGILENERSAQFMRLHAPTYSF